MTLTLFALVLFIGIVLCWLALPNQPAEVVKHAEAERELGAAASSSQFA